MKISGFSSLSRLVNQDKDNHLAIVLLEKIIAERETELREYAQRQGEKASEGYLKRENSHNLKLREVHRQLYLFHYQKLWMELDEILNRLNKYDPHLTGVMAEIRIKPGNDRFSFLNFNLY